MPVEVYAVKVRVKNDRFAEAGNLRRSAWKGHASHGRILGRPALSVFREGHVERAPWRSWLQYFFQ